MSSWHYTELKSLSPLYQELVHCFGKTTPWPSARNESPAKHTWSFEVTGLGLVRTSPKVADCPKIPEVLSVFSTWVIHYRPWPVPVMCSRSERFETDVWDVRPKSEPKTVTYQKVHLPSTRRKMFPILFLCFSAVSTTFSNTLCTLCWSEQEHSM